MARRRKGQAISGWINLDKPLEITSTQAVGRVRRLFDAQKGGHAGTLDPLATGILPIALGEATKTVSFLVDADKAYRFTIAWGRSTTTLDREGETTGASAVRPTADEVAALLPRFVGQISQVPPAFSAIKVDGRRSYDLARQGQAVELAARIISIHSVRVAEASNPDLITLEMTCGKGAYVRALVRDLAQALGTEGHVHDLRRTRVGPFGAENAVGLEFLEDLGHKARQSEALLPVETALDDIPALALTETQADQLRHGQPVLLTRDASPSGALFRAEFGERLVALVRSDGASIQPVRVFNL